MGNISLAFMCNNINTSVGGTERVTRFVADKLANEGFECFYIYSHIDDCSIDVNYKLKIDQFGKEEYLKKRISEFIENHKIDVLIVVNQIYQTKKYQSVYNYLKAKTKVKIIGCLHAAPDNWKKKDQFSLVLPKIFVKSRLKRYLCYFYNRNAQKSIGMYHISDRFLLLSNRYIPIFCKTFHIDDSYKHKLFAIPNPCPFNDEYAGEKRKNVVLIVSRMAEIQKRIYFALKVWKKIIDHTNNWSLVIVGDGPQLNDYKSFAQKNKLNNVQFIGHSNKVSDYYKTSRVFFMTSIWEGQPMSVIEAMHYGCVPVVVDSFESIHDLVEEGKNGVLCRNNDFDDVCIKLASLLDNEKMIDAYSSNILNKPNELFSEKSIMCKWISILTTLTQKSR